MRIARSSVLISREYIDGLADIFYNVKVSSAMFNKNNTIRMPKASGHKQNGKAVIVLLSASNKLYGEIVPSVYHAFEEALTGKEDIIIIGKAGRQLFEERQGQRPFRFFDIPDTGVTTEMLQPITSLLLEYEKVTVYHGKFTNVIKQQAIATSISGDAAIEKKNASKEYLFLFEPSIEEILLFFQSQVFSSLFAQTVHESELARYASRIKAMEDAQKRVGEKVASIMVMQRRLKNTLANKKQLQSLAGMSLWKQKKKYV